MMTIHTMRLTPGQDLLPGIENLLEEKAIQAGCILTCVGSLRSASLRLADQESLSHFDGPFEIVSLVGTVSVHGSHLHLSIADTSGTTFGGHLGQGCVIYTTAEIVIGEIPGQRYLREMCPLSGYPELVVEFCS